MLFDDFPEIILVNSYCFTSWGWGLEKTSERDTWQWQKVDWWLSGNAHEAASVEITEGHVDTFNGGEHICFLACAVGFPDVSVSKLFTLHTLNVCVIVCWWQGNQAFKNR